MLTVGSYEAKTHFSELLEKVSNGEQVVITKHRHPLARLVPEGEASRRPISETIAGIRGLKSRGRMTAEEIAEMIADGRR